MKDYVDLTQLPPNEIDRMVADLNCNSTEGLRRFYEHLGLLYGYPLEQIVNVFSENLMFNKRRLHEAFDEFSFKKAVLFLKKFLDILSVETTPLSVVESLCMEFEDVSGYVYNEIPALWEQLSALSDEVSLGFEDQRNYIDDQLSTLSTKIPSCTISAISLNGTGLSVDEYMRVDIPAPSIEELARISTYLEGYADGIKSAVSGEISSYGKWIDDISANMVCRNKFIGTITSLKCMMSHLKKLINCKTNTILNECLARICELSGVLSTNYYTKEQVDDLIRGDTLNP